MITSHGAAFPGGRGAVPPNPAEMAPYRIQRIEQLASLDLTNPDHRLSAHVATKIVESQRPG